MGGGPINIFEFWGMGEVNWLILYLGERGVPTYSNLGEGRALPISIWGGGGGV